jgi:26S proteasome regulatory subunit N10
MICLDNSEWMRNSDFSPSRFEAQEDACNLISGKKTSQNLENVVGLMTTAGKKGPEVHVGLSQDPGKLLTAMHKMKLAGEADLTTAIQVARLALRHRQNKKQEQRIVLFVGSPVRATEKELSNLGAQLKKNKVAIDIVSFGEENAEENQPKLEALQKAANNSDNCRLVTIPPGAHMLSEMLQRTPIVRGDGPDTGGDNYVDDNIDPELAEALRLSMAQAEVDNRNREGQTGEAGTSTSTPKPITTTTTTNNNAMDEDPELAEAIRLSMMGIETQPQAEQQGGDMNVEEDDELARAIQLSRETANNDRENDEKAKETQEKEGTGMVIETPNTTKETQVEIPKELPTETSVDMSSVDPEYMSSLFLELPGIDPNDPEVQALLNKMKTDSESSDKDKKEEKK